jgi:hypothetical protein
LKDLHFNDRFLYFIAGTALEGERYGGAGLHQLVTPDVRCVQVKVNKYLSAVERDQLKALAMPMNVSGEFWRFVDGQPRQPRIEIL